MKLLMDRLGKNRIGVFVGDGDKNQIKLFVSQAGMSDRSELGELTALIC